MGRWIAKTLSAAVIVSVTGAAQAQTPVADPPAETTTEAKPPEKVKNWEEPAGEVQDYHWLGFTGLATFGVGWAATIITAAATDSDDKGRSVGHAVVPVVGPFLMISQQTQPEDLDGLLIGMGVLQSVGALAMLLGFTLESRVVPETTTAVSVSFGPNGVVGSF